MSSHSTDADDSPAGHEAITWLRLLKLLLSIVLMVLGIVEALTRLGIF